MVGLLGQEHEGVIPRNDPCTLRSNRAIRQPVTPYLAADIESEEGRKLVGYLDSESVPTIGVGHTGPDVSVGEHITDAQATAYLRADIAKTVTGLDRSLPWWRQMDDVRQDVFVQMAFQMGVSGLLKFINTLAAAKRGDYARAADQMLQSQWAQKQTPARARRMSMQMRSGVRAWARASQQAATPPANHGGPETQI